MDENPLIALARKCYDRAEQQRTEDIEAVNPFTGQTLSNPWFYYDRIYRGVGQWDFITGMAAWASRPIGKVAFMGVENYTTLLCDNEPSIGIFPREETDEEFAEIVKAGIDFWWQQRAMQSKVALAVKSSRIFGIGWLHTFNDPEHGPDCKVVNPESVLVDPDCTVEDYDPSYLVYEYRAQYADLKSRYDGKKLPDGSKVSFKDFDPDPNWNIRIKKDSVQYDRFEDNHNPARSIAVYELWYKDASKVVFDDDVEGVPVKLSKKKYPGGRVVTIAGGMVIEDKANPYEHKQFPFTPVHAYPVPGKFYGIGDVQTVMPFLVMRNRLLQMYYDQMYRSGGGYVFLGQASGLEPKAFTNAPLQIIPCKDESHIRIERPPAPRDSLLNLAQQFETDANDALGLHDISQGKRTEGNPVTAQEASILAESDRTRVRSAARWLAWAIERIGNQTLSNLAQYHDSTWFLTIAGKVGKEQPMEGAQNGAEPEPDRIPVEFSGKMLRSKNRKDGISVDLIVADSSTLPNSRKERATLATTLYGQQAIPLEDYLTAVGWPNAKQTAAKMAPPAPPAAPGGEVQMLDAPPVGMPPEMAPAAPQAPDAAMMGAIAGPQMPPAQMPMPEITPEIQAQIDELAAAQGITPDEALANLMQMVQSGAV